MITSYHHEEALKFVEEQHPILDSVSVEVELDELHTPEMQQFFDEMLKLAKGGQVDPEKTILVGLSAPQVGKNFRVIVVDVQADGKGGFSELRLYINPEILEYSDELEEWYEGCCSTGDIRGIVKRPNRVVISALDRHGNSVQETHLGYVARIFQHEIDHLNGIRFPDRLEEQELLHIVDSNEMVNYRNLGGWRHWPHTIMQKSWRQYLKIDVARG